MIARGFKPVGWVAAVATAALGCYMLSLNVASERADLARVENEIVLAKRDIRALQTELGTRGRLQQLEHWNADVLALSAPASGQFLRDEFKLASYSEPQKSFEERAQVRMASAAPADAQPTATPAVEQGFASAPSTLDKPVVRRASLVVGQASSFTARPAPAKALPREVPVTKTAAVKVVPAKAKAEPVVKTVSKAPAKPIAKAQKPIEVKTATVKPVSKPSKATAPVRTALIGDRLAREIGEAAKAEKGAGRTASR